MKECRQNRSGRQVCNVFIDEGAAATAETEQTRRSSSGVYQLSVLGSNFHMVDVHADALLLTCSLPLWFGLADSRCLVHMVGCVVLMMKHELLEPRRFRHIHD